MFYSPPIAVRRVLDPIFHLLLVRCSFLCSSEYRTAVEPQLQRPVVIRLTWGRSKSGSGYWWPSNERLLACGRRRVFDGVSLRSKDELPACRCSYSERLRKSVLVDLGYLWPNCTRRVFQ